ncbi:MAG: hypothetical protein LBJ35_03700 [Spirochaetaceae bacterium]|jgi:hypothetical protein|nr:hypothetical protein [Spirochaetaceae bacterium]
MPKQFRTRIDLSSPAFISVAYPLTALIVLILFRLIFPDVFLYDDGLPSDALLNSKPLILDVFRAGNILTRSLLDFISLFPAIFISAQLITFCRSAPQRPIRYQRFSPEFFKLMRPQLAVALAAVVFYGLLFLVVRPMAAGYQIDIQTESVLFAEAKEKTIALANKEEWTEAYRFLSICERIWPESPDLADEREIIGTGITRIMYSRAPTPEKTASDALAGAQGGAVNAQSALRLAETALKEDRFYDAHRLAVIAGRISREGSAEATLASRLAGAAWNAIETLEPDAAERRQYSVYQRKRDGYEAMVSGDWIHAYYTFRALLKDVPNDPDVKTFFEISTHGLSTASFFIDEIDRLGLEVSAPFFSLPLFETDGRLVMRLASILNVDGYSYGKDLEAAAFDADNNPLFKMSAPYVKFLPLYVDGKQFTIIYLQAWGRDNEQMNWGPVWEGTPPANTPNTQLALAISYEDFLLASSAGKNIDGFFIGNIWSFARNLASYGYVPEVYQAEIIYIISEPLLFLPLTIFSLIAGWNLRGKSRSTLALYPMFIALPFVLNGLIHILRGVANMFCIFTLLSFGFTPALLISFAAAFLLFILGIVLISAQRS